MIKKIYFIIALAALTLHSFSQVSESKSGVLNLNISKSGNDLKKFNEENRGPVDIIPPVITLQSPELASDSVAKTSAKTLVVKGTVKDAGGVFEVDVNGVEAKVSSDGVFLAEIPQAFGRNKVTIKAIDVSLNSSVMEFYSERLTSQITDPVAAVTVKPVNTYSIDFISPAADNFTTANDKFNLQACIKSTLPIKKLMIYRDGSFINGFLANNIVRQGDCSFLVDEPLSLKLGLNDIKIEVFTGDDTISKDVTIEYSFYAARSFAVIIGNQKYDDPSIPELEQPLKDAAELYNTLTSAYNFEPANVIFLKKRNQVRNYWYSPRAEIQDYPFR